MVINISIDSKTVEQLILKGLEEILNNAKSSFTFPKVHIYTTSSSGYKILIMEDVNPPTPNILTDADGLLS